LEFIYLEFIFGILPGVPIHLYIRYTMLEPLINRLNQLHPLSDELREQILSLATLESHRAGSLILKEGQVCHKASMVLSGLLRSYYIKEGKDITSRFMDEGFFVTSWMSYYTQQPGNEFIEAIEDTQLACLNYENIQRLYNTIPESNIIGRKQTEYAFYLSEQRTQLLRKHTAEEKYRFFVNNHQSLLQRVPLKHIATYLGMNEETLSRVRSKFHKNN
jgi:CRP/FNR family transcriptional regulator, anaerobic regulatory protein